MEQEDYEIAIRALGGREIPFLVAVKENKHIGYGRMIQIIQKIWDDGSVLNKGG